MGEQRGTDRHAALQLAGQAELQRLQAAWPRYGTPGAQYIPRQRPGLPAATHYRRPSRVLGGIKRLALWALWLTPWAIVGVLLAIRG